MKEATITARVDFNSKVKVNKILKELGLTHSSAINLFYNQILLKGGLPFDVAVPDIIKYVQKSMIAEPAATYNTTEELFEESGDFGKDIRKLLYSFGKSKKAKEMIVKLAVEHFIDEMEFIAEAEKRLNDEDEETVSYEEFKKEFDLE